MYAAITGLFSLRYCNKLMPPHYASKVSGRRYFPGVPYKVKATQLGALGRSPGCGYFHSHPMRLFLSFPIRESVVILAPGCFISGSS